MTQREQNLATVLLAFVVGGVVLFLGYLFFWVPLQEYDRTLRTLDDETNGNLVQIIKMKKDLSQLERWRLLSLPSDPYVARREYDRYLNDLLRSTGVVAESVRGNTPADSPSIPGQPGKKAISTPLTFSVRARATPANLAVLLERFQRTPLMHKIKNLTIEPADGAAGKEKSGLLLVLLTVEALILDGADRAPPNLVGIDERLVQLDVLNALRRGPAGLALVPWAVGPRGPLGQTEPVATSPKRTYADIARRNIFTGAPPPPASVTETANSGDDVEMTQFVYLTVITRNEKKLEAFLRNRATTRETRLRVSPGFDTFRITDETGDKTLVRGKVLRIDPRDVYFVVNGEVYGLHVGQNLSEALRRPLNTTETQTLGLTSFTSP